MGGPIVSGETIAGVVVEPRAVKTDSLGTLLHYWRADSPYFVRVGEVYCSAVNGGAVKAWKRHHQMTQRLIVPTGRVLFAVYDARPESASIGAVMEIESAREAYGLLIIPPMLWYGFKGLASGESIIINSPDLIHDPDEMDRLDSDADEIPYTWK
jgi:dTDP-4-dehydrorhamnose 3,5-epimerase